MERVRVMVIDDHPIYRQGLRSILESVPDIEVVGDVADGKEAVAMVRSLEPNVAIVDVNLPGMDGLEVARNIKLYMPRCGVIMVTGHDDEEQLFQCIKVGAAAFFLKTVDPQTLIEGIFQVSAGDYLINESILNRPMVARRVLNQFRDLAMANKEAEPDLYAPLSSREIEVLDCISHGQSNKEIAKQLKISDQTVKNHITSILRKLNVNDRTQAVVYALRRGWIKMQGT